MKKYVYLGFLMFSIVGAMYCYATPSPSLPITTAIISGTNPGDYNPYCRPADSVLSPPIMPRCPEGQTRDPDCVKVCKAAYKAALTEAYATACQAYKDANINYASCAKLALYHDETCVAAATTLAEREACRDICLNSINVCIGNLNAARTGISYDFTQALGEAETAYNACAAACCH